MNVGMGRKTVQGASLHAAIRRVLDGSVIDRSHLSSILEWKKRIISRVHCLDGVACGLLWVLSVVT